ncbi:hypothetical protein GCM10007148_19370 [Parvularcula lutaonensis]|nr:hypothetical protein GCM10007148_19370 [Parvularcula lutaonensis]
MALPAAAQAQRSAFGVDWSCGYEEGKVFVQRLKRANQEDLSCLVGAGFLDEALPRIGGRMDEDRQRLRMLLRLLVEQDPEAEAFFEKELAEGTDEAAMWLLIANGERGLQSSDRRTRNVAVNLFISLPPWTREMYASKLADALLAEGDTRAALTLATALRTIAVRDDELARAAMIQARVIEVVGSTDEAVALYQEASELGNDRLQAEADLRRIALMWRTGYITTDEAVAVLQELVTIWRGEDLGTGITLALARAYYFDQQLPQALRLLYSVAGSNAPEDVREEATRRIKAIAEDLFIRRLDPATIGDLMDVYELVRPLVAEPDSFWLGDLKLAEILVEAGLMTRTEMLMRNATPARVAAEGGNAALLSAAQLMIAFNDRPAARAYLGALPRQELSTEDRETFDLVEARALDIEDLPSLLQPGTRREVLAIVTERAWAEEAYGLYAAASALSNDRPTWRQPAAKYLSRGERLPREDAEQVADVRLRALSSAPKPSVYHANDLRPLLAPSAEVAGLASTLTQIGQELSEEASKSAPADADAQARNERTK